MWSEKRILDLSLTRSSTTSLRITRRIPQICPTEIVISLGYFLVHMYYRTPYQHRPNATDEFGSSFLANTVPLIGTRLELSL